MDGRLLRAALTARGIAPYDPIMATTPARLRRWTRAEYDRLIEIGFFQPGDPVELIGGDLVVAEPQSAFHYTAIQKICSVLGRVFGAGWQVRSQGPIALDDESEPEPDVAVVRGTLDDYRTEHPSRPVLVVEVALSSLGSDRERKGSLYARAGLRDYWILDLESRALEVHREPAQDASAPFGWRYRERRVLDAAARVSPLEAPDARIPVAELLP